MSSPLKPFEIHGYKYGNSVLIPNYDQDDADVRWYRVPIPDMPPIEDIDGFDLPKKDQKFKYDSMPEDFSSWGEAQRSDYIFRQWTRRQNGYWFMNNGTPTYITGEHYMYLNHWQIDSENRRAEYRDRDRRWFLFWRLCKLDPNCFGMAYLKHRRDGATNRANLIASLEATSNRHVEVGIISKTGKDARDTNWKLLLNSFNAMPSFFQPVREGNTRPKESLRFYPQISRAKDVDSIGNSDALFSSIEWRNTTVNAFDGKKLKFLHVDEPAKWAEVDIKEFSDIHRPCFMLGGKIVGKALYTTTMGEMDKEGGAKFSDGIWFKSDPFNRNLNNRTTSGFYRYFVPAYDGWEGYIDEYGMSVMDLAKQYQENERKGKLENGDFRGLAAEKRAYPWTPREAMASDGNKCRFNIVRVQAALDMAEHFRSKVIRFGNLVWYNNEEDTYVRFVECPESQAKFQFYSIPEESERNNTSRFYSEPGNTISEDNDNRLSAKKYPGNYTKYIAGLDPINREKDIADVHASKAVAYVKKRIDPFSPKSDSFICMYNARPHNPFEFYEDMIKLCVFFGCQLLIETATAGVITHFKNRGYASYLMKRPDSTRTSSGKKVSDDYGVPATELVNMLQEELLEAYIERNIPLEPDYSDPESLAIPFPEMLRDMIEYDPANRRKHDHTVAAGLTVLGDWKPTKKIMSEMNSLGVGDFFQTYNNSGSIGRLSDR